MSFVQSDPLSRATTLVPDLRVVPIGRMVAEGRWRIEAMRSYDRPVLIWFTRGQGRITIVGAQRGYGPHNAIFLPRGTMHGFDTIGQVFGTILHLPRGSEDQWPDSPLHLRLRDAQPQGELTALIDSAERELAGDLPGRARALESITGMISVWLERNMAAAVMGPTASPAAIRLVGRYTALVEQRFTEALGIAEYAKALAVTPTHLTRCCNQVARRTAHDILTDRKLFDARRRLREETVPVSEIARNLGFRSPAYFTRAFKANTGQSPTAFRAQPRN